MVPSLDWFIYAFVRKEAVVSSQIEGTQATLIDLLEYEAEQATGVAIDDVREICNYLDAVKYARGRVKSARGLPISTRLLNETHRRLMRDRKSTRLNSSHDQISYAVFCLKKKK